MDIIVTYIAGLVVLTAISLYALIVSRSNRLVVFVLIPALLLMSVFTWQAVEHFRGTPIVDSLPEMENVTVIYIRIEKPDILYLIRHPDTQIPHYYREEWTEEKANEAKRMQQDMNAGLPMQGQFTRRYKNGEESLSREFIAIRPGVNPSKNTRLPPMDPSTNRGF